MSTERTLQTPDIRSIADTLRRAKPYLRERYNVREIGIFGSYARNEQTAGSDVDILVDLAEPIGWDVVDLKDELEQLLGLPVDLVLKGGIARRPKLLQSIREDATYV
ncbi:nucleotidyltransferase family protein [Methanoculleus sp. FWC-SCC1]|uniref:protein adenylyltransferase n=1 Tax=Methanoculleus frigidifontis TaxID=2584085 RepID=A0ABT8MCM8_9EURY|nr:nucleotidyltransferase family protein [Methanoculleus sp. FWC-SCC1]MDN7025698.1 nucleotidyltransferase family protein [Methanoculleus sp. FWC-SCC1]